MVSKLPPKFVDRLRDIIPSEHIGTCLASFSVPKRTAFRVNTLLASVDDVRAELDSFDVSQRSIPWLDIAFWVAPHHRDQLLSTDAFRDGRIYVQNPSSMLACLVLDPKPSETILDLAAAPGGKTTMIAAMMGNEGVLSAVEPIRKRFFKLRDNLQRCGVTCVKTYMTDGRTVGRKTPKRFDRVLLDAPCSGESRFREDDPKSYQYWSDRKIREQSRKQVGLIKSAIRSLKPGGTLVYCTCAFSPEENELAVQKALRRFDNVQLESVTLPAEVTSHALDAWQENHFGPRVGRRVLPNDMYDGFYLCKISLSGDGP